MENKKYWLLYMITISLLISCAAVQPQLTPEEQAYWDAVQTVELSDNKTMIITIPKNKAEDIWAKVQVFISKYSSMKIQTAADNVFETYNPTKFMQFGYKATRLPLKDEVQIEVLCVGGGGFLDTKSAQDNMKILGYYLQTEELQEKFIKR